MLVALSVKTPLGVLVVGSRFGLVTHVLSCCFVFLCFFLIFCSMVSLVEVPQYSPFSPEVDKGSHSGILESQSLKNGFKLFPYK